MAYTEKSASLPQKSLARVLRGIWRGDTLMRCMMHEALIGHTITGKVIDVGGGSGDDIHRPPYFHFLDAHGPVTLVNIDFASSQGAGHAIDLEKDPLPFADNSIDTVLAFNIFEHIYNHDFLASETYRVARPGAQLLGFVPFLINYHPHPHDFFRYTSEALIRLCGDAGWKDVHVEVVGGGIGNVNFNNIVLSLPRILRVPAYLFYGAFNWITLKMRPALRERFPLGYMFWAKK